VDAGVEFDALPEAAGAVVVTVAVVGGVAGWLPDDAHPARVTPQISAATAKASRPDPEGPGLESPFLEYPALA
jgi:hypothetical protein